MEKFGSLGARLALVSRKRKKIIGEADGEETEIKRSRTTISVLGGEFIDHYLDLYRGLSGDTRARTRLYKTILDAAKTREETLHSGDWTPKIVATRLRNMLAKQNREAEE